MVAAWVDKERAPTEPYFKEVPLSPVRKHGGVMRSLAEPDAQKRVGKTGLRKPSWSACPTQPGSLSLLVKAFLVETGGQHPDDTCWLWVDAALLLTQSGTLASPFPTWASTSSSEAVRTCGEECRETLKLQWEGKGWTRPKVVHSFSTFDEEKRIKNMSSMQMTLILKHRICHSDSYK